MEAKRFATPCKGPGNKERRQDHVHHVCGHPGHDPHACGSQGSYGECWVLQQGNTI